MRVWEAVVFLVIAKPFLPSQEFLSRHQDGAAWMAGMEAVLF